MKKDQKFLNELNEKLGNINTKKKDAILLKYKNIIEEEKKNGKKITVIIKSFGSNTWSISIPSISKNLRYKSLFSLG